MVPNIIKRSIFNVLSQNFFSREISILLGARQVGKSTLLRQLESKALAQGLKTLFFDLEQSSDLEQLSGNAHQVFEKLTSGPEVVFLDEFHYLENASKIFKAIFDSKKKVKIFASGSSSLEMHRHLKESLAGRFQKTMIFPLTLSEYLQNPQAKWEDYLVWGGMPGLTPLSSPEEKINLLENIVSTYLAKDIKALIQEENVRAFNSLLYLLAQNQGALVSLSSLSRETGLSEPAINRHLEIMAQTYVCFPLPSFSQNLANELKKSKKYYLFDLGIRNGLLKDFRSFQDREDKGIGFESFVFLHLKTQLKPNMELRFWRTKKGEEVDFIFLKNRIPVPIEVKSTIQEGEIPKGLALFLKKYPKAPFGVVFSENGKGELPFEKRNVYFRTFQQIESIRYFKDPLAMEW